MTSIVTRSGMRINLLDPQPDQIEILDIAHALAHLCRWTGHTSEFYSVAQHSCYCSYYANANIALATLMHDAAEAYLGDVSRPLKIHLGSSYKDLEARFMLLISLKFGFDPSDPEIAMVDNDMLVTEAYQLIAGGWPEWAGPAPGRNLSVEIVPWTPAVAYRMFMERFLRLTNTPKPVLDPEDPWGFKANYAKAMIGYNRALGRSDD